MKYSFVLPTYNRGVLLKETLFSLINQYFEKSDFEIIIIDDNSKDNTESIIGKVKEDSDISLCYHKNNENKGVGYNRNLGIELAHGEIIIQTEDDAKYPKDYLSKINDSIEKNKDKNWGTFIVYPRKAWNFDEGNVPKLVEFRRDSITLMTKQGKRTIMGGWIFRKDLAKDVGGYKSLKIGEDTEFVQRINKAGYKSYAIYSTYWLHQEPNTFKKFYIRMYKQGYAYKEYKDEFKPQISLFGKLFWLALIIFPVLCLILSICFGIYGLLVLILGYFMLTLMNQETRGMYPLIMKSKYKNLVFLIPVYYFSEIYGILIGRIYRSFKEKCFLVY